MNSEARASHLVVIGSSAGGVQALTALASGIPADFPAPIVVAQHLDPTRPSHLQEILTRHSALPVKTVTDREALASGTIYVVPSDRQVAITDHEIRLSVDGSAPRPSVDRLFSSAAAVFGDRLIAVVLSGTGSDGSAGALAVHDAGGTVIIQNPETAAFSSMPRSLAPLTVDAVVELDEIGPLLTRLLYGDTLPSANGGEETLGKILSLLREQRGVDFSQYRRPTLWRRLQRRMMATRQATLDDYLGYLRGQPEEAEHLIGNFLITVTSFYRDPKIFAYLRDHILPDLIQDASRRGEGLRIWSAGCATGEEAYSLAILVMELQRGSQRLIPVRIFATDLGDDAVDFARRGVYSHTALQGMPQPYVERYFHQVDGEYEIDESARSLIVFGPHDLVQMPPFPHIDLILCRNVLMYFTPELQQRALQVFAFALREGGRLVVGTAETVRQLEEAFSTEQARLKVYRRNDRRVALHPGNVGPLAKRLSTHSTQDLREIDTRLLALRSQPRRAPSGTPNPDMLLLGMPVGVVVVDGHYDIQLINTFARRLLGIHGVATDQDFIHLLENVDGRAVRRAIDVAIQEDQPTHLEEMAMAAMGMGQAHYLQIVVVPWQGGQTEGSARRAMVVVTDITEPVRKRQEAEQSQAAQQQELQRLSELMEQMGETNRRLLSANEELATAEAIVRASKDEAAMASEAAQAATEELETYAEELQATTEELEAVNEELRSTVEELSVSNADLDARADELVIQRQVSDERRGQLAAILDSMADAVLVVDSEGRTVSTNAAYDRLVASVDMPFVPVDDGGHPLSAETTPHGRAARGETFFVEFSVVAGDGSHRWFEANGRPVSGVKGANAVVVIRDTTERSLRKLQEQFVAQASHELRTPLTTLHGYLQLLLRRIPADAGDERDRRLATSSLEQMRRLETLVDDLMDVTRLRNGNLRLHLEAVDLVALASRVVEIAQAGAEGRTMLFAASADSLVVEGDGGRLESVLFNLLTNAIKYAPGDEPIEIRLRAADGAAEIQVVDRGPGIGADDLPHIFERFYQVNRPGNFPAHGLGLGLFIARELVTAHGGTVDAASEEGAGTTFTVRLPLRHEGASRHAVQADDANG